jgi:hypothetical protein
VFGRRYFGGRFYGARYFGDGGTAPAVDGSYNGARYFGPRFFGPRYFSPNPPTAGGSFDLGAVIDTPLAGVITITGGMAFARQVNATPANAVASGPAASVTLARHVNATPATATASGPAAAISIALVVNASPAIATASGPSASISLGAGVSPGTTGAVVYLPIRMVSGMWRTAEVTPTSDSRGLKTWLPPAQQPIGYLDNDRSKPVFVDTQTWYAFINYLVNVVIGGPSAPTLPAMSAAVSEVASNSATVAANAAAVAQQAQANAEALAATVEVVKANSLTGSGNIPPVQQTIMIQ